MKKILLVLGSLFILTLVGCAEKPTSISPSKNETQQESQVRTEEAEPSESTAPPIAETQPLDGKKLVEERCSACHTIEQVQSAQKDKAGWESTIDRMIGKGARLTGEERQVVIDHLSSP